MSRLRRTIPYLLAAALLVASVCLALFPAPATAHYVVQSGWQEDYYCASEIRSSVLQPEGCLYRLKDRMPHETETVDIPIEFDLTHKNIGGSAEAQIRAEVSDASCLSIASGTGPVSVPKNGSSQKYTVCVRANHVKEKKTVSVEIFFTCGGETLSGIFRITLLPQEVVQPDQTKEEPESGLFSPNASMNRYMWGRPICMVYAIHEEGTLFYKAGNGTYGAFPRFTSYRIGNDPAETLYEPDTLSLKAGNGVLILDFNRVSELASNPPAIGLKITLKSGETESCTVESAKVSTHQSLECENGIPTVYVANRDNCGLPDVKLEHLTADPAHTLRYETVTDQIDPIWNAQDEEGGQYLTIQTKKDSELPAGSYRMTLTWTRDTVIVYQQKCVFYVNYF